MIRPSSARPRPFEKLAVNKDDRAKLLQAERDALPILLFIPVISIAEPTLDV